MTTILYDLLMERETNEAMADVVADLPVSQGLLTVVRAEAGAGGSCGARQKTEAIEDTTFGCCRTKDHLPPHVAISLERVLLAWTDE